MSLETALQALTDAHGPKALADAFSRLQGQVRRERRQAQAKFGALAETFVVALRIWDQQKLDGVSITERVRGLEKTLRASWPALKVWYYGCETCSDAGLEMSWCDGDRPVCGRNKPHLPHDFGRPCFCPAGNRFKAAPKLAGDAFASAGRTTKPTRLGR